MGGRGEERERGEGEEKKKRSKFVVWFLDFHVPSAAHGIIMAKEMGHDYENAWYRMDLLTQKFRLPVQKKFFSATSVQPPYLFGCGKMHQREITRKEPQ